VIELYIYYSVPRSKCKRAVRFFFLAAVYELGLDISNCGGQGYDNGAHTKIKSKQTQILYINL
jgi:hypothetical protein